VHATVVSVLPASLKLLTANNAAVGLLARMVAAVLQEFSGREELLGTYVTDERTIVCVLASMHSNRAQAGKSSAADITVKRTLSCVRATVLRALLSTHE